MTTPPTKILPDDLAVLPAVRILLSQHPSYRDRGAPEIADGLFGLRYMSHRPKEAAVEAALEALHVEGEVVP